MALLEAKFLSRCGSCGYFERAHDPEFAKSHGKCLHRGDGGWIAPSQRACSEFTLSTPARRNYTTWLGLALALDSVLFPGVVWAFIVSHNPHFQTSIWLIFLALIIGGIGTPAVMFFLLLRGGKKPKMLS